MVATVYGLASTRDSKIRYVGQTCRTVQRRYRKHCENARLGVKNHLYNWMRSEIAAGHRIFAFTIEATAIWGKTECRLIAWYRRHGADLVNQTDGGDGCKGWKHTPESRIKMVRQRLGKKLNLSAEARDIRREQARRMGTDPEIARKRAKSLIGNKLSPESIAKRTATRHARGNYEFTPEQRAKRSKIMREWWAARKEIQA